MNTATATMQSVQVLRAMIYSDKPYNALFGNFRTTDTFEDQLQNGAL